MNTLTDEQKKVLADMVDKDKDRKMKRCHPTIVYEIEMRNGMPVRVPRVIMRDYSVPFTPQSGEETKIGVLSHMVACNMRIEHKAAYLSKLGSGNPFDISVVQNHLSNNFSSVESKYSKDEK